MLPVIYLDFYLLQCKDVEDNKKGLETKEKAAPGSVSLCVPDLL